MFNKWCPFFSEKSGGFLSVRYECLCSKQEINTYDPIYKNYCSQKNDYEKCPFFRRGQEK